MPSLAERVVARFRPKMGVESKALIHLVHTLTTAAGGVNFLAKAIDPDTLPTWDKELFYRLDGENALLYTIVGSSTSSLLYQVLKPFWLRAGRTDGVLDEEYLHLEWDESSTITLELRAWGPSFARYGEEAEDMPSWDYDRQNYYVEVPEQDKFLDDHLRKFAAQLGGKLGSTYPRREKAEGDWGEYDQFRYDTKITWRVVPENLIRQSIGKLVIQAGEAIHWTGEDEGRNQPTLIESQDILEILSRQGDWPKDSLQKGDLLLALRRARTGEKLVVEDTAKNKIYFKVQSDKKGVLLVDALDRTRVLRVQVRRATVL